MSDTFDHEADAWDSLGREDCDECYSTRTKASFHPDPLHYHVRIKFNEVVKESPKSYLIRTPSYLFWIPKKICREFNYWEKTVWIHRKILSEIIKKLKN